MVNEELRKEILEMVEEDQNMRRSNQWDEKIYIENTNRLKEIIKEYGWPGISLVKDDGANGAWFLAQHADHNPEFQKQALNLLEKSVAQGEASKKDLAYLTDRVMIKEKGMQLFGTQFFKDKDGQLKPKPIENIEDLEKRRKDFGLNPFVEYEKIMQEYNN